MNKVYGLKSDYAAVKKDASRVIVCYGFEEVDGENATWYEVYLPMSQMQQLNINVVKEAVYGDINARTDDNILEGFVWNDIKVWLSAENQRNFSEAQRMASAIPSILPLTFKLGETEEEEPVYHTFESVEELDGFYVSAFAYINQCLNQGWQEKDAIDWQPYEEAIEEINKEPEPETEPEPEEEETPSDEPENQAE